MWEIEGVRALCEVVNVTPGSVAPKSLTGMVTIPKLMEPLQIGDRKEPPALFNNAPVVSTELST